MAEVNGNEAREEEEIWCVRDLFKKLRMWRVYLEKLIKRTRESDRTSVIIWTGWGNLIQSPFLS